MGRTTSSFAATVQHRVLGVAFLLILVLFAGLTVAIFNKSFVSYDEVKLQVRQDRAPAAQPRGHQDPRRPGR